MNKVVKKVSAVLIAATMFGLVGCSSMPKQSPREYVEGQSELLDFMKNDESFVNSVTSNSGEKLDENKKEFANEFMKTMKIAAKDEKIDKENKTATVTVEVQVADMGILIKSATVDTFKKVVSGTKMTEKQAQDEMVKYCTNKLKDSNIDMIKVEVEIKLIANGANWKMEDENAMTSELKTKLNKAMQDSFNKNMK